MKNNQKILFAFCFYLAACSHTPEEPRMEGFAKGLPEGDMNPATEEYALNSLPVNLEGLVDADVDGVIDQRDTCEEQLHVDAAVDNSGCKKELSKITTFELTTQFDTSSFVVKKKYDAELKKLAALHQKSPDYKILIEGHTDSTGPRTQNVQLSLNRAKAVANVLLEKYKVPVKDILVSGLGPDQPVASNKTPEGRQKNRRMLAHMVYDDRITEHQWNVWSVELGDKKSKVREFYDLVEEAEE